MRSSTRINTNAQLGTALNQIASHPGQTASAVGAVASKYPLQLASRFGSGVAVSVGFSPYVGVPVSGLAVYGSAFKAAYQHPDAVAAAAIVGEMCPCMGSGNLLAPPAGRIINHL